MAERTRVLIPIGEQIGGPMSAVGIRQFEVGRALAPHCDVTFASTATRNDLVENVHVSPVRCHADFRRLLASNDVLFTLGLNADRFLDVVRSGIRIILDVYAPLAFEMLEMWPEVPTPVLHMMQQRILRWTLAQLTHADVLLCTNEQQRDMWLGTLLAAGVLDATVARRDPDGRKLVRVVPYGVPEAPALRNGHPLRERFPEFGADDFVLLWSSKIFAWQDPLTLVQAMHIMRDDQPRPRLVFVGIGATPAVRDPFSTSHFRTAEARRLADDLGLTGRHVFFVEDRVPYRDMASWYLDAHAGVATYPATLETHFCLGSRLMDFVWAGLPMIVSGDDLQKQLVEDHRLGYVVPPENPEALAAATRRLRGEIATGSFAASSFEAARSRLRWSVVTEPVVDFCRDDVARTRRRPRRALLGTVQLAEFMARSAACRHAAWRLRRGMRRQLATPPCL